VIHAIWSPLQLGIRCETGLSIVLSYPDIFLRRENYPGGPGFGFFMCVNLKKMPGPARWPGDTLHYEKRQEQNLVPWLTPLG